jgi:cytochrome P450
MKSSQAAALARVHPPTEPLPPFRLLRTAVRNPIEIWPEAVYREAFYLRRFAGRDILFVSDPDIIREVLVDRADAFVKAETMRRSLEPALGKGLLTAEGEQWRWQRRAASPTFRHERLLAFAPEMIAAAERTRDRWIAARGSEVDVAREMMLTTYDVIARTMLSGGGVDEEKVERAVSHYLDPLGWVIAMSLARLPRWLPYPGRLRSDRARAFLRGEIVRMIAARRAAPSERRDLVALLLEARDTETGAAMSDVELADNILTFITAGHETTALALTWTFYLLDRRPETARQLRAEVEDVTGGGELKGEHVADLTFTRQVLQEAMRLYPPAAVVVREATRDLTIGGQALAAGAQIYVPIYAVHRHVRLWREPDSFDPERFTPDAVKARHRYAYLPFGAGPRICIGMSFAMIEAALILATLLRSTAPKLRQGFEPGLRLRVTLRPATGMPMHVDAL